MALSATPTSENVTGEVLEKLLDSSIELVQLAETKDTNVECELTRSEISAQENPRGAAIKVAVIFLGSIFLALFLFTGLFLVAALIWGSKVMILPIVFLIFFMPYAMFLVFRNWFLAARRKVKAPSKPDSLMPVVQPSIPPPIPQNAPANLRIPGVKKGPPPLPRE